MPLCYVYPAMLHYKACARTRRQKAADIALMVFGLLAAAYTTVQTVRVRLSAVRCVPSLTDATHFQLMMEPQPVGPPPFGQCDNVPAGGF